MGRKRKRGNQAKPFCYYCGRSFDQEKVLIQHQKARHFKCQKCPKKMATAHALMNHMHGVHKETLTKVMNAKPGRDGVELAIYGMSGVPEEIVKERASRKKESSSEEEGSSESEEESPPPPPPPQQQQQQQQPQHPSQLPPAGYPPQQPYGYPPFPGMPPPHMMMRPGMPPMGYPGYPPPMGANMGMQYPGMGRGMPPPPQGVPPAPYPNAMGRGVGMPPAAAPAPPPAPVAEKPKANKASEIFIYDGDLSMEEARANLQKYQV